MQFINSQIRAFIAKESPNDAVLTDFINNLTPDLTPTVKFHQLDLKAVKEPTLVYAHLMVQDNRQSFYYYSLIMKRPFRADEKFMMYRWGNSPQDQFSEDTLECPQYLKVMLDRQLIVCAPVPGLTDWAAKMEGKMETIELMVDGRSDFKLGEVIDVVAFYYPDHNKLYFVRRATQEEILKEKLCPLSLMKEAIIDFQKVHHEILSTFSAYCSESFAEYLLLCLLSEDPIFIGAQANISPLIELVYPRVKHLKLVHPCEQSLFPYKNEEGELIQTPMQLSNQPTFISIDLSAFSEKEVVQIGQMTINNFKALKVFIEESKTVYRWEFGESLVNHRHRGVVVKASSFLNSHFHPKDQQISVDFSPLSKIPEETLKTFRDYIAVSQTINPELIQEERIKIQQILKSDVQKNVLVQQLSKVMQLSKLIARSYGRQQMLVEDFQHARQLVDLEIPLKPVK